MDRLSFTSYALSLSLTWTLMAAGGASAADTGFTLRGAIAPLSAPGPDGAVTDRVAEQAAEPTAIGAAENAEGAEKPGSNPLDASANAGLSLSSAGEATPIAQGLPHPDDVQPLDLTPIKIPERASAFSTFDSYKARLMYMLPARMFFSGVVENSIRLETNVFQTSSNQRQDLVYRVLPNVTAGYALNKRTRVGSNFFFFRDQYTAQNTPLSRNIYSVGIRADRDFPINERTAVTASLFCRELFFNIQRATPSPLSDIIPQIVITRRVGQRAVVYGSVLGQIRFTNMLDRFQEGDQFYSFGVVYRRRPWLATFDTTFITNFGNSNLRGGPNNQLFVLTAELARRLSNIIPMSAFIRAEPIFNMGANSTPGFAGFNFRLYGGLRAEVAKPAIFPIKLRGG